jgi:hypothetical protein
MGLRRILSVSRRTDLPAFHLPWFHEGLEKGFFMVENPVSGKRFHVPVSEREVAALVFWSKNYRPFLRENTGEKVESRGMGVYLHFTLNTPCVLEPDLPSLDERLGQMAALARRFGPENLVWRFDPICHWKDSKGQSHHNLGTFLPIAEAAARAGIRSCTTSFLDPYPKVLKRAKAAGIFFQEPEKDHKKEILRRMALRLRRLDMTLFLCCEPEFLEHLRPEGILPAACIPGEGLKARFGPLSLQRDKGQRPDCRCTRSTDIGSYRSQACAHNCLYCYAR